MNYENSRKLATMLAEKLINIYFEGIDRKVVSAKEALHQCPEFIKDIWQLMINKILNEKDKE